MCCREVVFKELCEISSLGCSVPEFSAPLIPLLLLLGGLQKWSSEFCCWAAKGEKWGAGLGGFLSTGVRITGVGKAECSGTRAAVGHGRMWQQKEAQKTSLWEQQWKRPEGAHWNRHPGA